MADPTLDEILAAGQSAATPSLDQILAAERPPSQQASDFVFDGVIRLSKNMASTGVQGLGVVDHTAANVFQVLDKAARFLSEAKTGMTYGGAFAALERSFRNDTDTLYAKAEQLSPGDHWLDRLVKVVGRLPADLALAMAAVSTGGPVAGMAALGAIQSADHGLKEAVKGAIHGATLGGIFRSTSAIQSTPARAGATAVGAGAVSAAAGAPADQVALDALTMGTLAGITPAARPGLRPVRPSPGIPPEAPSVKPRLKLTGVLTEPGATVPVKPPVVEITNRASDAPTSFLGKDYREITPPDRAVNLNLRRITGPDELKSAVADLTEFFRNTIDDARRGTITEDQTRRLAEDLGLSFTEMMQRRKGQALNAEEAVAYRTLNRSALENWFNAAQRLSSGRTPSESEVADFLQATGVAEATLSQTLGATAEAGRALRSFRYEVGPKASQMRALSNMLSEFRQGRGMSPQDLAEFVSKVQTPEGLAQLALEGPKATTAQKFLEVWKAALLTGPQTHAVNVLSNTLTNLFGLTEPFVAATAALPTRIVNKLQGGTFKGHTYREAVSRILGTMQGISDGLRLAGSVLKSGVPQGPDVLFGATPTLDSKHFGAIEGAKGQVIRAPFRALLAEDAFFQTLAYQQSLRQQAMRQALGEGLRGRSAAQRAIELARNPSESLRSRANEDAKLHTFTESLGETGRAIQHFAASHVAAGLLLPFVRTPTNIFKFSIKRSPLGVLFQDVRLDLTSMGSRQQQMAMARIALGSSLAAWVGSLVLEDRVTGTGPADKETRADWLLTHQPFSVKVGDRWISYARLEPLSTLLGISADFSDIWNHIDEKDADELGAAISLSFSRNVSNKTFLQSLSALAEALADEDKADAFLQQMAGTVVPAGVAQVERAMDPTVSAVDGMVQRIRSRIPGLSADLPPRRNVWGEPIQLQMGLGPDLLSPLYAMKERTDPESQEVLRLEAQLTAPDRKYQGIEMTPQEYSDLMKAGGQAAKQDIHQLVTSPTWKAIPDPLKRELIEESYTFFMGLARDAWYGHVQREDPDRVKKGLKESSLLGELNP